MPFALTIFVSAFLLFQVQPLIARVILPWFGGSAAVWTACMLFFQVFLVAGYLYAWWLARQPARRQSVIHIVLLIGSLATLPILPGIQWKPVDSEHPIGHILLLLSACVGLPYFLLSTTSPLVQTWFARATPNRSPYRLFALSNLAALIALISYPVIIEPFAAGRWQGWLWSGAYGAFALIAARLAWQARDLPANRTVSHLDVARASGAGTQWIPAHPTGWVDYALWMLLPACASVLLLAFTTHLTQNVAPIPFLWILPLVLYLLSFITCFDHPKRYDRRLYFPLLAVGFGLVCFTLARAQVHAPLPALVCLYATALYVACMVCHGELARIKPDPSALTSYYLLISAGGALGGLFVGIVAPTVFNAFYELPVGLVLTVITAALALQRSAGRDQLSAVTGSTQDDDHRRDLEHGARRLLARFTSVIPAAALIYALGLVIALAMVYEDRVSGVIASGRNFYAALQVDEVGSGVLRERVLTNGTIIHGMQFISPERRTWATSYYGEQSGVGLAVAARRAARASDGKPLRLGMVGLGVGTLVRYGQPGDTVHIYEINPLVRDIAYRDFHYLAQSQAQIEFSMGDARLSLEREAPQPFDVLAIDAFSSDSIPVHLLTVEAMATYFRNLDPQGILAVHISNRYLDLAPVLLAAANALHKEVRWVQNDGNTETGVYGSTWVLLANAAASFAQAPLAAAAEPLSSERTVRLWTDDYSDLISILR